MTLPLPDGIRSHRVATARLDTHVLEGGPRDGEAVVFVHGNVSSSRFFAELMASLPAGCRGIAPDLRGFGGSQVAAVDATRGVGDFADDVVALLDALEVQTAHLVGWSVGGAVIQQIAVDHPGRVRSLTLISPMSPFGFGGTKDAAGAPCWPDWSGTGGGTANPDFVARLSSKDRSSEADTSPRKIMNAFYFKPPFTVSPELEEAYVSAMLDTATGPENYPGDMTSSENWPTLAPGPSGVNNAISGQYCDVSGFGDISSGPPVLWIRGDSDQVVSDTSFFDFGFLGQLGAVPGWPGAEVFPPQPMLAQTRGVLDRYAANGGRYREEILADCGHSPHIEKPERFLELLLSQLTSG